jgi:hypothetical protein
MTTKALYNKQHDLISFYLILFPPLLTRIRFFFPKRPAFTLLLSIHARFCPEKRKLGWSKTNEIWAQFFLQMNCSGPTEPNFDKQYFEAGLLMET